MSCDIGDVTKGLENEPTALFSNPYIALPTSQLILQSFHRFTQVTVPSTTFPLLHLHQGTSPTSPGELPMLEINLILKFPIFVIFMKYLFIFYVVVK